MGNDLATEDTGEVRAGHVLGVLGRAEEIQRGLSSSTLFQPSAWND